MSCPELRSSTTHPPGSFDRARGRWRGNHRLNGVDVFDFDADVVQRSGLAEAGEQDQFEGRVGDREVRVAVADLRGFGLEQLGVELDRSVEVGHVEGQLHTGHDFLLRNDVNNTLTFVDAVTVPNTSTNVNALEESSVE